MILLHSLKGVISGIEADGIGLDVGGLGFFLLCSKSVLRDAVSGQTMRVLTSLQISEAGPLLFGFSDEEERVLFQLLLKVRGIGPRLATTILRTLDLSDIINAIATGNSHLLCQVPGVGKKTAEKAWKKVSEKEDPLDVLMSDEFLKGMPKAARAGLEEFRKIMRGVTEDGLDGFPAVLLERVIDEGYGDHLRSRFPDAQSRADDLSQLSRYAAQFRTLHDFLGELALFTSAAEIDRAQGRERPEDRVVLSTIHQAKGLEWSVVFLIGCAEGMFPLARALKEDGGEEEERRLFYVAATRAKDELYICYPSMVFRRGLGGTYMGPSRFIEEIRWGCSDREKSPFELWQISNF